MLALLAVLDLGGSGGNEGLLDKEPERDSHLKGPRRGGSAGGGPGTGGVEMPEEIDDSDPRFLLGGSCGGDDVKTAFDSSPITGSVSVSASEATLSAGSAPSFSDISLRRSSWSAETLCSRREGDFLCRSRSVGSSASARSANSEAGVTVWDLASAKSSCS